MLGAAVLALAVLILRSPFRGLTKTVAIVVTAVLIAGFTLIDAKVWGVALMGLATLIFFLLPWLDQSAVKSVRYKGPLFKAALGIFVVVFLVLGFYGTQPVTDAGTRISQVGTLLYFAFFILMPWYSRMDRTSPVPARVTK